MKKLLITSFIFLLFSAIKNTAKAYEITITDEVDDEFSYAYIRPELYSVTFNQHGQIFKTSVGVFYLGNSKDVIYDFNGRKKYGHWQGNFDWVVIFVDDNVYQFY